MGNPRLLILGGTFEARQLAEALAERVEAIVSLAGRTADPAALAGHVRIGGFGGAAGLARFLAEERIDLLIDATHPFAARISAHAYDACRAAHVPRLQVLRPPWQPRPRDLWVGVPDAEDAAAILPRIGRRVLLTVGRQELAAFARVPKVHFVVRLIEPPSEPLPLPEAVVVLGRPPFTAEAERALMAEQRIDVLVSKNSGGLATAAKLHAARDLGVKMVMIDRPPPEPGPLVASAEQAVAWINDWMAHRSPAE